MPSPLTKEKRPVLEATVIEDKLAHLEPLNSCVHLQIVLSSLYLPFAEYLT